jgi:sugar phosphate isomerase/epimerase
LGRQNQEDHKFKANLGYIDPISKIEKLGFSQLEISRYSYQYFTDEEAHKIKQLVQEHNLDLNL